MVNVYTRGVFLLHILFHNKYIFFAQGGKIATVFVRKYVVTKDQKVLVKMHVTKLNVYWIQQK